MVLKIIPKQLPPTFELEGVFPASMLGVEDELVRPQAEISYSLSGFMTEEFIEIRGELKTKVMLRCGRCGEWLPNEVKRPDFQVILDAPFPESIDLTPQIREDILIDLPFAPACKLDGEYKCPVTGEKHPPAPEKKEKSLGTDEVWKALEKLKPKE